MQRAFGKLSNEKKKKRFAPWKIWSETEIPAPQNNPPPPPPKKKKNKNRKQKQTNKKLTLPLKKLSGGKNNIVKN